MRIAAPLDPDRMEALTTLMRRWRKAPGVVSWRRHPGVAYTFAVIIAAMLSIPIGDGFGYAFVMLTIVCGEVALAVAGVGQSLGLLDKMRSMDMKEDLLLAGFHGPEVMGSLIEATRPDLTLQEYGIYILTASFAAFLFLGEVRGNDSIILYGFVIAGFLSHAQSLKIGQAVGAYVATRATFLSVNMQELVSLVLLPPGSIIFASLLLVFSAYVSPMILLVDAALLIFLGFMAMRNVVPRPHATALASALAIPSIALLIVASLVLDEPSHRGKFPYLVALALVHAVVLKPLLSNLFLASAAYYWDRPSERVKAD